MGRSMAARWKTVSDKEIASLEKYGTFYLVPITLIPAGHKVVGTRYSCALSAFGARTAPGIKPYRIGRFSRGPVSNASKRQFGSANLGSPGPLSGNVTQGFQSESCLGGWRCKGPSKEVDRRRRGWTASRNISRPSGRSRAKAKDGRGSHSELLSRMDEIG